MCDQATGTARLEAGSLVLEVACGRCGTVIEVDRSPYSFNYVADPPEMRPDRATSGPESR